MPLGLLLDALTLSLVVSYLLSLLVAVLPEPRGNGAARSREALRRLGLPPLGALLLVAIALWPAARTALGGAPDHCDPQASTHAHLCWLHGTSAADAPHDAVVLVLLALGAALTLYHAWHWGQARGRLKLLHSLTDARRSAELRRTLETLGVAWPGELHVLALGVPLCFVTGLRSPRLFVSAAVIEGTTPEQLAAMVLHERAHVRHGDNVWRMLGQLAQLGHLPGIGRRSYRRWTFAAEVACDEAAAAALGSRTLVAEALVRYQRLLNERAFTGSVPGVAFGAAETLERRVALLMAPPEPSASLLRFWPGAALALLAWQTDAVHVALEALLEWFHG